MVVSAELHLDEQAMLPDDGSRQAALWGINLYPSDAGAQGWMEFNSMINKRPSQGNRTPSVDDPRPREHVTLVVTELVQP